MFKATTIFAEFVENGINPIEPPIEETGDFGIFDFSRSTVNYTYLRNDSLYTGLDVHSIDRERYSHKTIFSSNEYFLLLPPDQMPHDLSYNKTDQGVVMMLQFSPKKSGPGEAYSLFLRKKN